MDTLLGSRCISGRDLQYLCPGHLEMERHRPGRPCLSLPTARTLNRQERRAKHGIRLERNTHRSHSAHLRDRACHTTCPLPGHQHSPSSGGMQDPQGGAVFPQEGCEGAHG